MIAANDLNQSSFAGIQQASGSDASDVAHDLRNMLQCAMSALRISERRLLKRSDPETALLVRDAAHALDRAGLLAESLLDGHASTPPRATEPLSSLIEPLLPLLVHSVGPDITIQAEIPQTLPMIGCDVSQFENVLFNLAINARDAMPEGGKIIIQAHECSLVDRHPRQSGGVVVLSVSDTGLGMAADVLERVFEKHYSTKGSAGRGHGLASARRFAVELGGAADISSREGAGTTVRLYLPALGAGDAAARLSCP